MATHPDDYRPAVTIFTTQRCNYRCIMCFYGRAEIARELQRDDRTMSMDLYERAVEQIAPYCSTVSLTSNGEFLMDPMFEQRLPPLVNMLRRNPGIKFFPISNASLLTREKVRLLEGIPKIGFTISIDTVDPLEYASIRRPGVLSNVVDNIRALRANLHGIGVDDVHIQLNMVLLKRNIFSLPQALQFAKETHATLFVDHPQGWGGDFLIRESLFNVPVFANRFLDKCRRLAEQINVAFDAPPPFAVQADEIERYYEAKSLRNAICPQLNKEGPILIAANGDVGICCQNIIFGNMNQQSFKEIFFSPLFDKYREAIAVGKPLAPCDNCRWIQRRADYLYESADYELDIPPAVRNLNPSPDLEAEGFFDWLDEFSEKRLRSRLRQAYFSKGSRLLNGGLNDVINNLKKQEDMNGYLADILREDKRVVIYPAGGQMAWMLKHTILSKLNILGCSDKNAGMHGKQFHGYEVVAPEQIAQLKPDLVMIASDLYKDQILRDLSYLESEGIRLMTV